jgi:hypothetical protein
VNRCEDQTGDGFDRFIRGLAPFVPAPLVAAEEIPVIEECATCLPARISSFFGLECRLKDGPPAADLLVHMEKSTADPNILKRTACQAAERFGSDPWRRVHLFAERWAAPESTLHGRADNIWLEFDVARSGASAASQPSLFFSPSDEEGAMEGMEILITEWGETGKGHLARLFRALPDDGLIFQIGAMLARKKGGPRICVCGIKSAMIPAYLEELDWPGNLAAIKDLLATLEPLADRINLDLDLTSDPGAAVHPGIGLECAVNDNFGLGASLLDHLLANGLASAERQDALHHYVGAAVPVEECWPRHIRESVLLLAPAQLGVMTRRLHHIKIGFDGEKTTAAKAYLSAFFYWARMSQRNNTGSSSLCEGKNQATLISEGGD